MKPHELAKPEGFAEHLRYTRLDKRILRKEVEAATGISGTYLYYLETGQRPPPTLKLLKKLEVYYGCEPLALCREAWKEV